MTFRSFFTDKHDKIVLTQAPNLPLIGWAVSTALDKVLRSDSLSRGFSSLGTSLLLMWAYLEVSSGASLFRRLLGSAVAVLITVHYFRQ